MSEHPESKLENIVCIVWFVLFEMVALAAIVGAAVFCRALAM